MKTIRAFFRRLFCQHAWVEHEASGRYSVCTMNGKKVGEVTLTVLDCVKCGKSTVIPTDRSFEPEPAQEAPKTQP